MLQRFMLDGMESFVVDFLHSMLGTDSTTCIWVTEAVCNLVNPALKNKVLSYWTKNSSPSSISDSSYFDLVEDEENPAPPIVILGVPKDCHTRLECSELSWRLPSSIQHSLYVRHCDVGDLWPCVTACRGCIHSRTRMFPCISVAINTVLTTVGAFRSVFH